MMLVDETKPDTLAERAAARQALANAINGVDTARARLSEAKRAAEVATDRAIELRKRVDALAERVSSAKSNASADSVIAALLRGDDMHAERSPTEIAQAELDALQGRLESVRRARQIAEDEVVRRKSEVGLAEMRVKRMAAAVLRASGATERLLAGLIDLERQVVERRLGLAVLLRHDGVPLAEKASVERVLDGYALPTRAASSDPSGWGRDPTMIAWADTLKALATDPDARLPG
jgi:hypothetical protein